MLDIIIPIYNDIYNLPKTLYSLTSITCPFKIYIIDDCSTELANFNEIINTFTPLFSIQVCHLPINSGPGVARQKGIDISSNPFILFLDCGDIIINGDQIENILNQSINCSIYAGLAFGLYEEFNNSYYYRPQGEYCLKSYILRRSFLQEFNIKFITGDASYYFEDVGFIRQVHLVINSTYYQLFEITTPLMVYTWDDNSLTKKNNSITLFKNMSSEAKNCIFAIEQVKSFCTEEVIDNAINESLICIYLNYTYACGRNKNYIQYVEDSLRIFLQKYFNYNKLINNKALYHSYIMIFERQGLFYNFETYKTFINVCLSLI